MSIQNYIHYIYQILFTLVLTNSTYIKFRSTRNLCATSAGN